MVPWQTGLPHEVPDAKSWHDPAPLHWPVFPHVAIASAAHSLSGSLPALIGPQVPSAPAPFFAIEHA
jgi:hypothetical protein